MAQFILMSHDNLQEYSKLSRKDLEVTMGKMMAWAQGLRTAGIHRGGEKLTDRAPKIITRKSGQLVVDGPFAETKEIIGGFFVIEVENEEAALRVASECPILQSGLSRMEVREVADDCRIVLDRAHDSAVDARV